MIRLFVLESFIMKKLLGILVLGLLLSCTTTIPPKSCIKGDCKSGYGTFVQADLEYTGEFKNGKANGEQYVIVQSTGSSSLKKGYPDLVTFGDAIVAFKLNNK